MCTKRNASTEHSPTRARRSNAARVCAATLACALTACAPTLTYDGEMAKISTIEKVANCSHLGTSTLEIEKPEDAKHRDELTVRARNLAGKIGANRIVVFGRAPDPTREIRMYVCQL